MNEEKLFQALERADAAGDTEAATFFAQEIKALRSSSTTPEKKQKSSWGQDFQKGFDDAKTKLTIGYKQIGGFLDPLGMRDKEEIDKQEGIIRDLVSEKAKRDKEFNDKYEQGVGGALASAIPQLPLYIPHPAALPLWAANIAGSYKQTKEKKKLDGVDESTATKSGLIDAGVDALSTALPGAAPFASRLARAASGGVLNSILYAGQQKGQQKVLENYPEVAKQHEITKEGLAFSAGIGTGVGAISRGPKKSTPEVKPSLLDIDNQAAAKAKAPNVDLNDADILAKLKQAVVDQKAMDKTTKGPLKTGRQAREGNIAAQNPPNTNEALNAVKEFIMKQAEDEKAINKTSTGPLKSGQQARDLNRVEGEPHPAMVADAMEATKAIDEQAPTGAQFGGTRAADAAELEALNTPPVPPHLTPDMQGRYGNDIPSGVVNPKALEAINRRYGPDPMITPDQANRYGGPTPPGVVNPKALDAVMNERPLQLFPETAPTVSPEAVKFQQAMDAANKAANKASIPTRRIGPKNQRGMINFGALFPEKTQKRLDRSDVNFTISDNALNGLRRAIPNKSRGPLDDFWHDRPYEEIINAVRENPKGDVGSTALGREVRGGISSHATVKNDPITGKAYAIMKQASNAPDNLAKKYIMGDSHATKHGTIVDYHDQLKKNPEDFYEVMQLMTSVAREGRDISPETLKAMTPEQRGMVSIVRDLFDDLYQKANKAREVEGLPPMEKRPFYFPATFTNTYRTLVSKKVMKDGKEVLEPVEMLGSNFEHAWQGKNSIANLKKKYEGKAEYELRDLPRRDLNDGDGGFGFELGMTKYIEMVEKTDSVLANQLRQVMDVENAMNNRKLFGMHKHEIHRKGITGSVGDQPWLSAKENAENAYEAMINYAKQAAFYYEYKTLKNEFDKQLTHNPEIQKLRPKALKEAELYFKNAEGTELNNVGALINKSINLVSSGLGVSPTHITAPAGELAKRETQLMIGTLNPIFVGQQLTQMLTSHAPYLALVKGRLGAGTIDTSATASKAVASTIKSLTEHFTGVKMDNISDFDRRAFQYAKDNQMVNLTEMEHVVHSMQTKAGRKFDQAMELGPKIGEITTRPTSFMIFANMIKQFDNGHYTDAQIFDIARQLTQQSMIAYDKIERPYLWNQMGVGGQYFGKFKTYPSGYVGSQRILVKEATKGYNGKKQVTPAVASAAAAMALGGIVGLPFFEDASDLITDASTLVGKRVNPKQFVMENLPTAASVGMLSDALQLNLSPKFSSGNIVPDTLVKAAPVASRFADQVTAVMKAISDGGTEESLAALGLSVSPPGPLNQATRYYTRRDKEGFLLNKDSQRDAYRSPEDWTRSIASGAAPLSEALDKELRYMSKQDSIALQSKRTAILKKLNTLNIEGVHENDSRRKSLVEAFLNADGTPEELTNGLIKRRVDAAKTGRQRDEGTEVNTPVQIRRYNTYNKPRNDN